MFQVLAWYENDCRLVAEFDAERDANECRDAIKFLSPECMPQVVECDAAENV
jgi:hypothetical protein